MHAYKPTGILVANSIETTPKHVVYIHTHIQTDIYTNKYMNIYTYTHTHTYIYTYTCIHIRANLPECSGPNRVDATPKHMTFTLDGAVPARRGRYGTARALPVPLLA